MGSTLAFTTGWVCIVFLWSVFRRYLQHRRLSHLFWSVSLAASAVASFSYCGALWGSGEAAEVWFRLYYILGALWMPAWMGLGSLALVLRPRWVWAMASAVTVAGAAGSVLLSDAPIRPKALAALAGQAGTGILAPGAWLGVLIPLNTFGAAAVIGIAVWSAWKTYRREAPVRFLYGNLWLAFGVLVISMAGTSARMGWGDLFWGVMFLGWGITYWGYRLLTPPAKAWVEPVPNGGR
ncbi:MAG: hypothetical protein K6T81_14735 [Alicyclobacillus macrosporangiidus]|uniref:hypothetical protein n=1 Tax=Alicyclobacillus macrosporangiidus TaxID=392015 RepID=UPI0026EB9BDC|nr:hypothetical protein [Alicyclobacillus macrosporangiidus]MCL6599970.1 hypothetical protein [Alicyclobacillus macrosporangiidus]